MMKRLVVIGSLGLAVAGGARYALKEVTERAWEKRRGELLELALLPEATRRPWEVRLESLSERVRSSQRFDEITDSSYRAYVSWGGAEPRALDEFERVWLESLWGELTGLDGVLTALRALPLEELGWHGETPRLSASREFTHALCGRAWLALEGGDGPAAVRAWTDALRLARALDDGTIIGTLLRGTSEDIVLGSVRAGLGMGASATALRAELAPFYRDWGNVAERAEHAIRRDLSLLAAIDPPPEGWDDPAYCLGFFQPIEDSIAEARAPAAEFFRNTGRDREGGNDHPSAWRQITAHLHDLHARRNVAFTALAAAAHREQHGAFPASLAELADLERELTLDPRTGTELPYSLFDSEAQVGPPSWAEFDDGTGRPSLYAWVLR
jgi:hypothetical protein